MKKNYKKGFTLIELLVVIAIIGILASVILASLNSARARGTDAATKSDLDNARAQAELFYDAHNTYAGVCAATATDGINAIIQDASTKAGTGTVKLNTKGTSLITVCNAQAGGWAASVVLKSVGTTAKPAYWCVDSNGISNQTSTVLGAGSATTPPACVITAVAS